MAKIFWRKSKCPQKYFGFRSGSVLFVHPVQYRSQQYKSKAFMKFFIWNSRLRGNFISCFVCLAFTSKSSFMPLLKLRSSMTSSYRPLRATCTKTAAPTWFAEAIWTLLLFWPTVARSGRLDDVIDERS